MKFTFPFLCAVFMFVIFIQRSYGQPPNDTCVTAQTLVVGVGSCTSILYTNVAATTIGNPATPSCWSPNTMSNTVWFSFVATTADVEISTNFAGTLGNTQIAVYSGACGSLVQIGCQEDVNTIGGLLHTDVILHGLTVNNTYYIAVDGNGNTTGTFGVCVQQSLPIGPPLPIQDCAGAQTLCSPSALSVPDGVGGVGSTQEAPTCFGAPGERSSNWYTFTAATSGNLAFTITPTVAVDYDFAIFDTTTACLGTELSCNWSPALGANGTTGLGCPGGQCEPVLAVTAGQTYTILVDRFTAASNAGFALDFTGTTATFASPNPTFTGTTACIGTATQFTNTTNGNFTYSWNFGDGFTSNLENPSHVFATAGPQSVTLLVTAVPGGCQNSITQTVTVNPLPTVNAGAGGSVCPGACINLSGSTNAVGSVGPLSFSNNTLFPIPDGNIVGVNSPIIVSGIAPITVANTSIASVCINLSHTWDSDLDIFLQCPNGTIIQLSTDNGGLGENYTNTCFTPAAISPITAGTAPFTGTYAPEDSFALLNGCNSNGTWNLFVQDDIGGDLGSINNWTITFNNNLPPFTWSPTTAMTNATTLTPTVCPLVPTTYTLTANNGVGCTTTSQVTIGTTAGPTATISYPSASVCTTSGTQTATLAGTGAYTGGTYSSTLGLTINSSSGLITPSSSTPGPYTITYTIPASGSCPATTTTTTLTINAPPNAGVDGSVAVCDSSVASIDLFTLITGEQAGGVWTQSSGSGGTFNAGAGTFVPALGASTSTFTYTVAGAGPCPPDSSVVTITINPQANAGVDGSITVCDSSVASIDLFSLITGEQAGGVWTQSSGSGGTFNAGAGTFVPALGASTSTFAYTVAGAGPCPPDSSVVTITINPQANAGVDGSITVCDSSVASIDLFSLITGEQAGGVWTQSSGSGGTFNAGAGTFVPALGASTSTFAYTVAGAGPCPPDSSVVTITINPQANAGVDGSVTVCDSSVTSIDLFSLIAGEQAGGVWTQSSGSGGTFNAGVGTFVPALGASTSTFTYTVAGAGPCPPDSSVVTITINPQANAGVDGSVTVCDSSVASIDLFSLITGEQAGGVWTQSSGSGGTFNAGAGTFVPALGASTSTFTYTVAGAGPCPPDSSVVTITINPQPNAGVDGSVTVCDSSVASIDLFSLITGEQAGGVWTQSSGSGGTFNAGAGTFVPALGASTSTFTYTVAGAGPCPPDSSVVTITINPQANAGVDGSITVCDSSVASIDLFSLITGEQAGGVWTQSSGSGGTFNAGVGTFVPALGASTSTFTYTLAGVAPCTPDTSVATITINPQANAGVDGSVTVCDSSVASIDLFSLITGEQAGGVWTQSSGSGGTFNAGAGTFVPALGASTSTFTYTLAGVAPCTPDTSVATITINPQANAGVDGSVTVCDSSVASIDLFSLITGEQAGGVWTQSSGSGGTFNAGVGTFVPALGASTSTFTYTVAGVAPCTPDSSVATITINPQANAGVDGSVTVCDSSVASIDLFSLIAGEQAGGVWTQSSGSGGTFNAGAGTFVPALGASTSTFTYTVAGAGPCPPDSSVVTITINPQPNAGVDGSVTVCDSSVASIDLFSLIAGEQAGGVWTQSSGSGGTFNAGAGTFVPALGASTSTFTYAVAGAGPCPPDSSVVTITINPQPNAGVDGSVTVCDSSVASIDLFSLIAGEQAGGVWTQSSGSGGTFNAGAGTFVPALGASTSTFTYAVAGAGPCPPDSSVVTITINPQPNAGVDGSVTVCDSSVASIDLFSLITGEQVGGVWTQSSGSGGTFNAGAGTFVPALGASTSTFTYTVAGAGPCPPDSSVVTITINPQPNAGVDGSVTVCDSSVASIDLFSLIAGEQAGGVWTQSSGSGGTFNAGAGTFVPAVGASTSIFTYTVSGVAPCVSDSSLATVTINPVLTPTINCGASTTTSVIFNWSSVTGATGYTVSYQINANPVVVVGPIGNLLTYSVSVLAPGDNVNITVIPTGGVGTCFDLASTSCTANNCNPPTASISYAGNPFCSSDASVQPVTLVGTGLFTGGVYSSTLGLSLNATSGEIIASTSTPGPYTITYTIAATAGCSPVVATTAIVINAPPVAGVDGSVTVCESSLSSIDLYSLISGEQVGGVWTRTSGSGGTFNSALGTFVPAVGASSSTFTYTLSGVAPCASDSAVASVTINPVLTPTINCGASTTTSVIFNWSSVTGATGYTVSYQINANPVVVVGPIGNLLTYSVSGLTPGDNVTITLTPTGGAGTCFDLASATCTANNCNPPTASISYAGNPFCSSDASVQPVTLVGTGLFSGGVYSSTLGLSLNATSGEIIASTSTPGPYSITYTIAATAGCSPVVATTAIVINAPPVAGVDGSTAVCESSLASIDLFSLITGEQAGGVWTRSSGAGGTFNAGAGTFVPAVGASTSIFTYTVSGVAPCVSDSSLATVTINPVLTPTINCGASTTTSVVFNWASVSGASGYNVSYQINANPIVVIGPIGNLLTYSVSGLTPGDNVNITVIPTGGVGTCFDLASTSCTANNCNPPTASISYAGNPFCSSDASVQPVTLVGTGLFTGGVYSSTLGLSLNATSGEIIASTSTPGPYSITYTIAATAGCSPVVATTAIVINAPPVAGVDGSTAVCESSLSSIDLYSLISGEQAGGVWTRTSGTGGTFNAGAGTFVPAIGASSSTFTYTLSGVAPCASDSSLASVTINPVLTPTINCGASTTTSVIFNWSSVTGATGYSVSYQINANPIVVVGPIGNLLTYSVSGLTPGDNVTITLTPTGGAGTCFDLASATCTANNCNPPTASISYAGNPFCSSDALVQPVTLAGTGIFTGGAYSTTIGLSLNTANGEIIAITSTPGPYTITYTIAATAGCSSVVATTAIVINAPPIAGVDGSTAVCESSLSSIDLYSLISGEQAGGVWTRTSGSGGTFNSALGTFVPAVGASSSTFTYTLSGVAPCASDSSVASVTINPVLTPTINCGASTTTSVIFNWASVTGASGYTVSYQINANPIVVVGPIGNLLTYSVSGLTPGDNVTITLTPTGGAGTCFDLASATCTANNCNPPTASISYAGNPFCSSDASVQPVTLVGTGLFTGGVYSSTLGLSLNATSGEIIASTSTPGPYTITYTIAATAGCSPVVATTAIVINAPPVAGVDGSTAVCESSLSSIDLFSLISGEQAGGVWTRTSGVGGTFNSALGTFVPAVGASSSTFSYTVSGVAPCANDTSLATITINPQANAGVDGSVTVCDSSIASIDLFSLITGEQVGGVWTRTSGTGGTFNAGVGTFVPAIGASSSTFTYTLTSVAPCVNDTSLATIFIIAQPNAGSDGSTIICESSIAIVDLFSLISGEQAGGVWTRTSGAGGTFNASTGTFVPALGATTSTFTYTVAGVAPCTNDTSLATITINPQANAGVDGSVTICNSSIASIDLFSLITGEQAGGVWTRTSGAGGTFNAVSGTFVPAVGASSSTFTYTVSGVLPCVNDTSLATISIIAQPNAGVDGSTIICESSIAIVDLFSLISGEQAGGVWTRTSGAGGTFNASTGTFVPAVGASSSTFTYTVSGVAPCLNDTSLASITINPQPNAGVDGNVTVCDSSITSINLLSLITGEQAGGVWTRTSGSGGTFNAAAGTFVPAAGATSSTFTYTLNGVAPCVNDTSIATITINPQPNAGVDGSTSVCETNNASINLFSLITGEQVGGVWTRTSGTGGTFNATSGTFIPAVGATTSTFIYILNGVAPCIVDSSMATVTITAQPIAGTLSGIQTVCQGNTRNFSPTVTGGTWTSSNPTVATVTPLTGIVTGILPGIANITYTILGTGGCPNATVDRQITVTPTPQLTNSGINIICSNETSNVLLTATASGTNFTWTVSQSGVTGANNGSGSSINQTLSSTNGGTAIYTVTPSLNGCIGNAAYVVINVKPLPKPTLSNGAICIELATGTAAQPYVFNTGLGDSSHDFQWFFEGTTILDETGTTLAASEAGEYSVIATNTATGCISNEVFGTITSSIIADSFTTTVTDAFEDYPYIIVNTPSGTGPFQYQLDSGAFQNSNVFYNVPSGLHTINVKDNEGCTDLNGKVFILNYPHFFTPNGDTYNDTWNIWDLKDQDAVSIFIFDRYGKFIKEISPRGTGWDGTMNGYELPATDYWFTVDYFDPNTKSSSTFKSHFSLKR